MNGNGRSGFQNGEEVTAQGSRADGRGYLHSVRPENRSTLCSVMAQLTEETQPSFETTLKSKAVSESCNVKFTCVVTGYPVPELTWYKDDMEMDRYCGLPKYEIFRNGKTHTLHIYNCTLEDAAIYQASARNSKGIVTCSGVLEVGTMNEYQIHQRFFAKLKQKAQNKRKELEESRQQSKDNVQSPISLEPSQRKLLSPGETSGLVVDRDGLLKAQDKETVAEAGITEGALESTEPPEGTTELPNGFPVINENAKPPLTYIFETVEVVTTRQTNKGSQCKKKIKISNGEVSEKGGMSEDSGNVKEVSEGDVSLTTEEKDDSIEKEMKVGSSHHSPADKENQKQMDESDKTTQCDSVAGLESQVEMDSTGGKVIATISSPPRSIHIEKSYKVNETESAADNKKDATTVIPTLKALTNVPGFVAPPISVTFVDSNCEKASHCKDEINEVQSLVSLLREVKNDLDTERLGVSSSLEGKKENSSFAQYTDQGPDARHPGVTDCSTVAPLGFSTSKQTSSPPVPVSAPNEFPKKTSPLVGCIEPEWSEQGCKTDCVTFIGHVQKDKSAAETVSTTIPQTPLLSPATMRRFAAKGISYLHSPGLVAVPTIQIETAMFGEKTGERQSGKDGMLPCESSPKLKRADSCTIIPSATPEELASGARRKIFISKTKGEEAESTNLGAQTRWDDMARRSRTSLDQDVAYVSPGQSRRSTSLGAPTSQQTPPLERCSPILARKKATLQVPKEYEKSEETETTSTDEKLAEKKTDPFKAPQVIRKIRGEPFSDATGHLKLWCQFFNVLSDSTIKWYRDDLSIAEMERRSGDESQVALAIVQASSRDCGVYSCTIKNEYGMDSTDFLLSADILSEFILRDDLEAGEEIEMTPMVFSKGLADSGCWGEKLFGRIVIAEVHVGEGCAHKACKVKVIYGLEPVFESGSTCVIKVRNPIAYGTREENNLLERNLEITKEECKRQNLIRQYCNIFAAEARVIENFGLPL
ncbi:alpha-protein kinase 3-like, partial [Scleropages formosus]